MTRLSRAARSRLQQVFRRKWVRRVAWAVAVYTVVGFLVLPAIVKWQMRKQLPSMAHRAARVDAVRINPPASFSALPEDDVYLAQMEIELFARAAPKPDDLREAGAEPCPGGTAGFAQHREDCRGTIVHTCAQAG